MAELTWTEPALSDLDALAEYIALDNPDAASRLVRRILAHIEKLKEHPKLGPCIPELRPNARYRQIVETPCRIFYRYDNERDQVFILGLMRGEKLFQKRLLQRRDKIPPQ